MKKIIYSLVIMIAAGSLFTSCVNYDEPVGVQDLREAKASYLDALSGLRAADAELQKAYAEVQKAVAAKTNADAAYRQAEVKAKEIANEKDKADADKAIAKAKADAEEAALTHQYAMAQLNQSLEKLQKQIAAEALALTDKEQKAITDAISYLNAAITDYNNKVGALETAQKNLFNVQNGKAVTGITSINDELSAEEFKAAQEKAIADATAMIAKIEKEKEDFLNAELTDSTRWAGYLTELQNKIDEYSYQITKSKADSAAYNAAVVVPAQAAIVKKFKEDSTAWEKTNKSLKPEGNAPQPVVKAAWAVPDYFTSARTFAGTMLSYFDALDANLDILKVENDSIKLAGSIGKVDTLINGDGKSDTSITNIGIKGIIKVIKDNDLLKADEKTLADLEAAANEKDSIYDAHLEILKAGIRAYIANDDSVKAAIADTVAKAAALAAENDTLELATAAVDSINKADSTKAANLFAARKALAQAVAAMNIEGMPSNTYSTADVDSVLKAIKNFVTAKQAVFGETSSDSLSYYKQTLTGAEAAKKAILDLQKADFAQKIEQIKVDGAVFFKVSNQFSALKPNPDPNVIGGFVKNSYDVAYTISSSVTGGTWAAFDETDHAQYYQSQENLTQVRLSKPKNAANAEDVFSLVFKALGLTVDFWGNSWYDTVLNPSNHNEDAIFNFATTEGADLGLTTKTQFGPFGIYTKPAGGNYTAYKFADLEAAKAAKEDADGDVTTAGEALDTAQDKVTEKQAEAHNAFAKISNGFYDYVRNTNSEFIEDSFTAENYNPADSTWEAGKLAELKEFEEYANLIDPYLVYDYVNGAIKAEVAVAVAAGGKAQAEEIYNFVINNNNTEYAKKVKAEHEYAAAVSGKDALALLAELEGWVAEAEGQIAKYAEDKAAYDKAMKAYNDKKKAEMPVILKAAQDAANWTEISATMQQFRDAIEEATTMKTFAESIKDALTGNGGLNDNDYLTNYNTAKGRFDTAIGTENNKIKEAKWILAQIEAGVDAKTLAIAAAERALKVAEQNLAESEAVLKVAQAQYDAVMAKYVK